MAGQDHAVRPTVSLGYDPAEIDQGTIDQIVADLSDYVTVLPGRIFRFSEDPVLLGIVLDLLFSTLTGLSANVLYEALRPVVKGRNRLSLRLRLRAQEDDDNSRELVAFIDVTDAESFARGIDSVTGLLDRQGWMFRYEAESNEWEEIS